MNNSKEGEINSGVSQILQRLTEVHLVAAAYFIPIAVALVIFNNIFILLICGFGKEFYQKTSKTARIYYIALACGHLVAGTFFYLSDFTSIFCFYCKKSMSSM